MKLRIWNANINVVIEGDNYVEIFNKFHEQYPNEQHNMTFNEIVELPQEDRTPEEMWRGIHDNTIR